MTDDGTWSAHWEHTFALTEEGPLVLTAVDGGTRPKLGAPATAIDRPRPDPSRR